MWDPQLRPLRPGASLAGTLTHLSTTVFVGRRVKDRPAAPCLNKKHKTEHLTTFFALTIQGLTNTNSLQGRSFFIDIEGMVLLWYIDERLDVSKNKLQYVWHVQSHSGHSHASQRNCTTAASLEQCRAITGESILDDWWWERDDYAIPTLTNSVNKSWTGSEFAIVLWKDILDLPGLWHHVKTQKTVIFHKFKLNRRSVKIRMQKGLNCTVCFAQLRHQ